MQALTGTVLSFDLGELRIGACSPDKKPANDLQSFNLAPGPKIVTFASMESVLILTISGRDRFGLVEQLAEVIAAHGGNWAHCRMAHLAGRFAGLLEVQVPTVQQQELESALRMIKGLDVMIAHGEDSPEAGREAKELEEFSLQLIGSDHPGIVRDVFKALARAAVNVEELTTTTEAAPDSGTAVFRAQARLAHTPDTDLDRLRDELQAIAADVMVDLNFAD